VTEELSDEQFWQLVPTAYHEAGHANVPLLGRPTFDDGTGRGSIAGSSMGGLHTPRALRRRRGEA
jgi:hypothetical protein